MDADCAGESSSDDVAAVVTVSAGPLLLPPPFVLSQSDKSFCGHVFRMLRRAALAQYTLACLSTLGGANHLCDRPAQALVLARRQEWVGKVLKNFGIIVKAQVYQAVNFALLGKQKQSLMMFRSIENEILVDGMRGASTSTTESLLRFLNASEIWLANENKNSKSKVADAKTREQEINRANHSTW